MAPVHAAPRMEHRICVERPITGGFPVTYSRPITVANSQPKEASSKHRKGGYILSMGRPSEESFKLSLIHRIYCNIEMDLLPGSIDVSCLAHAAMRAQHTTVTASENGAFVDNHERHAVSCEWLSMHIEWRKDIAEAASVAGTAGARN